MPIGRLTGMGPSPGGRSISPCHNGLRAAGSRKRETCRVTALDSTVASNTSIPCKPSHSLALSIFSSSNSMVLSPSTLRYLRYPSLDKYSLGFFFFCIFFLLYFLSQFLYRLTPIKSIFARTFFIVTDN